MFTIKITPHETNNPPGKLADAELHFTDPSCPACHGDRELTIADSGPLAGTVGTCVLCDGHGVIVGGNPLAGLKLIGFGIWERRTGGGRNVTFPARQYSVNGERRSFALLRPATDPHGQEHLRDQILQAYADHEHQAVGAL
jgi:hypothetical protein